MLIGVQQCAIIQKKHQVSDLEFDLQAKDTALIKFKDKEGNLIASIKTLEGDKQDIKRLNDSIYKELKTANKKYKELQSHTSIKLVYKDKIVSNTVYVDRSDSCSPIYRDTIIKPLAKYIVFASKDSVEIQDSVSIPIEVIQYDKRENFFGRTYSYTDVKVTNPSTDIQSVTSYKKKEKNSRVGIIIIGVVAFIVGSFF